MGASDSDIEALWEELVRLCNDQISTPPFARLLSQKFTRARAQQYSIQMAYYVQNRRDCWGYVQGSAPLEIKKIIWQHEEDELIGRKSEGKQDHMTLAVKEGEVFGLSAEAFEHTARIGEMLQRDLGIPMKKQINTAEHVVMDVEHAHLLMQVARRYAYGEAERRAIVRGAQESLMIDRVYRGHLADMLEALP